MRPSLLVVFLVVCLALPACFGQGEPGTTASPLRDEVRIGTGPERELQLLAAITLTLLNDAGVPARVVEQGTARAARVALETGDVDLLPSYSGAVWLEALSRPNPLTAPLESYEQVAEADRETNGLVWLAMTQANATFAFVVATPPSAHATGITSLRELAAYVSADPARRLCVDADYASRSDGLETLVRQYGIRLVDGQVSQATPEEAVVAVERGDCVAGLTTATDGQAWLRELQPVRDDRSVFPAFVVALVADGSLARDRADVLAAVRPFGSQVTTERLGRWNARLEQAIRDGVRDPLEAIAAAAVAELRTSSEVSRPRQLPLEGG